MDIYKQVDGLATEKINGTPLYALFSYEGYSFWWRFKEIITFAPARRPRTLQTLYYTHIHYFLKIFQSLLLRFLSSGPVPAPSSVPLLFTLLKAKSKFFREIHAELERQKLPYHMVVYYPLFPSPSDFRNTRGTLPLERFFGLDIVREEQRVRRHFQQYENALLPILRTLFPTHTESQLRQVFRYATLFDFPESFRLFRMAQKMLGALRPSLVAIPQETGKYSYPVMAAARKSGIPVAALQSGVYPDTTSRYIYNAQLVSREPSDSLRFLVPDYTLVFGEKDREFLTQIGINPGSKFVPLGHPHYDALYGRIQTTDPAALRKKMGLSPDKKLVLWPTQTHAYGVTVAENERKAEIVFGALHTLRDTHQLVIKLHQGEDQTAPLYKKFNAQFGGLARIFDRRQNVHDLIAAADAVVITNSTVGVEAILFGKPLLLLDTNPRIKARYFTSSGLGLQVRSPQELEHMLLFLDTPAYAQKAARLRETFIRERYANFGRATQAIVKFLNGFRDKVGGKK